jgi:3-deoxy-D-manno-octulosonic-acid transferase
VYLLYDVILLVAAVFLAPYYLIRGWRYGKSRRGLRERLGFYAAERLAPLRNRQVIWVHAVSVGETRAAIPMVKALREAYPESALLLSNVTETGHVIAMKIPELDLCIFFPFDLSWVVRKVLKQIRPALVVLVETEIWPNFVRCARQRRIPVAMINGRISDRSFPRYRKFRPLLQGVLEMIDLFCMQTELDAWRTRVLGAPDERVKVTGNVKFDLRADVPSDALIAARKQQLHLPAEAPLLVAGSTHAGEEKELVDLFMFLRNEFPALRLVLVPRHPERCQDVAELLAEQRLAPVLRSCIGEHSGLLSADEVLIGDTLGEMLLFYSVADVIFVGGSLVPVGGHNILEALQVNRPVVFGPHMHNFKQIAQLVLDAGGGRCVGDAAELHLAMQELFADESLRNSMARSGHGLLEKNSGATLQNLSFLQTLLPPRS